MLFDSADLNIWIHGSSWLFERKLLLRSTKFVLVLYVYYLFIYILSKFYYSMFDFFFFKHWKLQFGAAVKFDTYYKIRE